MLLVEDPQLRTLLSCPDLDHGHGPGRGPGRGPRPENTEAHTIPLVSRK